MISLHTVYMVTLVSQATSALVLILLALSDHRLPGVKPLAAACSLHAAVIFLMPVWRLTNHWLAEAISAALLPFIFSLIHDGLESLVRERKRSSHFRGARLAEIILLGSIMLVVLALAPWSQLWSMQIARVAGAVVIARTIWMLWRTQHRTARVPALITAALLSCIFLTLLLRIPLEPHVPASACLLFLRELTIVEVTLLAFSFIAVQQAESRRLFHDETRRDNLTGLPNRRALEEKTAAEMRLAEKTRKPLALLMMDLDEFKRLNDTWGHPFGDHALRVVGDALLQVAAASRGTVGRMGGEEFAMLLPERNLDAAYRVAEQVRVAVADAALAQGDERVFLTVSIGVAVRRAGESTLTDMLRSADAALYRAKLGGRNRVVLCEDGDGSPMLRPGDACVEAPPRRRWRSSSSEKPDSKA